MNTLNGFSIIISDAPIGRKQIRFPHSKKKRIRAKWAKRPQNFKNLCMEQILCDQRNRRIICTTQQFEALKKATV